MLAYRINADGSTTLVGNTSLIGSGGSGTGTGSEVSVSPQTTEGAAIASMVVDGTTYNLKSGSLPLSGGTVTGATTFSATTETTSTSTGAVIVAGGLGVAKSIRGQKVYGAVYNDFAEYRQAIDNPSAGQVVVEIGDDTLRISDKRMMPGANIVSDTFGFAIGETEQCKTPIAVAGRVLAYTLESREAFRNAIGMPVCSGPNGTVSLMTKEEYIVNPHCIIGYVSAVPSYEFWGEDNILVNNRVWIKIK